MNASTDETRRTRARTYGPYLVSLLIVAGLSGLMSLLVALKPTQVSLPASLAAAAAPACALDIAADELVASDDGVHVRVSTNTDAVIFAQIADTGLPFRNVIQTVSSGSDEAIIPIPPGPAKLGCFPSPFDPSSIVEGELLAIQITDQAGRWVPLPSLACEPGFAASWDRVRTADWPNSVEVPTSQALAPEVAVAVGAAAGTATYIAGYPESQEGRFAVITTGGEQLVVALAAVVELSAADSYTIPPYLDVLSCDQAA